MKTKILFLIMSLLVSYNTVNAQSKSRQTYFVTAANDTTFCKELSYSTTGQGYLNRVEYTDISGKKVELKGRKEVPDVETFCIFGTLIDKTPLKADKPDGYIRYEKRDVDGKLKVYTGRGGYINGTAGGPSGTYRFFLKMPDGTFYEINKGNNNKYIKPYLLKCEAFKNEYKGDYTTQENPFKDMIKLYNSLCE